MKYIVRKDKTNSVNVLDFIPTGKENRLTTRELLHTSGIKDPAELRREIAAARKKGIPICNDGSGYYLAECPDDLERSIRRMGSRISKQIAAKKGMEKAARELKK